MGEWLDDLAPGVALGCAWGLPFVYCDLALWPSFGAFLFFGFAVLWFRARTYETGYGDGLEIGDAPKRKGGR